MGVERVDRVVLEHVHEVDPHELPAPDLDRLVLVVKGDGVDGVDLIALGVEVGVEAVHHHHHLVGVLAPVLRVDDEGAVEAPGDVLGEGADMAVVEVEPERVALELVDRALPGRDHPVALFADAVHGRRVKPVEVHGVGVL
ncbi:MAG: hypothetical protein WKF31_00910 [Thermoleophilaceae bacterium]